MTAELTYLTFWGVRGSIPTPVSENLGFGGNTACLAIRFGDEPPLIFDAGSGIRGLGRSLVDGVIDQKTNFHLFLTHFHWDDIQGIPYFAPLYHPDCGITFHSSVAPTDLQSLLTAQMVPPYFPVALPAMCASLNYEQVEKSGRNMGNLLVRPFPLHHPNGATGYRIESPDACIVYASDHEHGEPEKDAILREYASRADVLIYDAQYTPDEYEHRRGWGHSTWRDAVRLAREAEVKHLILFHHDPLHTDQHISAIVRDAQAEFNNTTAAKEGWTIQLGADR